MPNAAQATIIFSSGQLAANVVLTGNVKDGELVNADFSASAAIARSKLDFGTGLVNADVDAAAAIVYSKLSLANSIKSADIDAANGIVEGKLATSDITTGDVSTTKHGYVPKAPNDTSKFLRGDASWAAPSPLIAMTALEVLSGGEVLAVIFRPTFALGNTNTLDFGKVTTAKKWGISRVGSGSSMSSFNMALKKTGAPADNLIVRIETDSAGAPSGSLADANATASISGAGLTTSYVDTTVTFGGAFTLTAGVLYWVVLYRSGAEDDTNYYNVNSGLPSPDSENAEGYKQYTGSWGSTVYDKGFYTGTAAGFLNSGVVKNRTATTTNAVVGIAIGSATLGGSVNVAGRGQLATGMTGLSPGLFYPPAATAGTLGTGVINSVVNTVIQAVTTTTAMVIIRP